MANGGAGGGSAPYASGGGGGNAPTKWRRQSLLIEKAADGGFLVFDVQMRYDTGSRNEIAFACSTLAEALEYVRKELG